MQQLYSSLPEGEPTPPNSQSTQFNIQNNKNYMQLVFPQKKVLLVTIKHGQNFYHKSDLEKLLQISINLRENVTLKKIRNQLKQMKCFKASLDQQEKDKKDSIQIIKRDNHILTNVIAMYAQTNYAKKGTILQATANYRETIKILIRGNIGVYQPQGNKAYKYCYQKYLKHQLKFQQLNLLINQINQNKKYQRNNLDSKNSQKYIGDSFSSEKPSNTSASREKKIKEILKIMQNNKFCQMKEKMLIQGTFNIGMNEERFDKINFKQLKSIILQNKNINQKQGFKLLTWSNINSTITPHKMSKTLQKWGQFISSYKNSKITNQKERYQASIICLSDCAYLQIDFDIFKQILILINNDQQKPYIRALLKKFENMQYYEAKRYVKIGTMIDKKKMYKRESYKQAVKQIYGEIANPQAQNKQQQGSQQSQNQSPKQIKRILKRKVTKIIFEEDQRIENKIIKKQNQQKQMAKREKQQIKSQYLQQRSYLHKINQQQQVQNCNDINREIVHEEGQEQIHTEQDLSKKNKDFLLQDVANTTYQVQFSNEVYFIVEGEVTLLIDRISAYRISQTVNANLKKSFIPKSLLKLYSGDMFGFEAIGNNKEFNLRYKIKMNSKILKMSNKVMQQHFKSIQNFQTQINLIKQQRDSLLKSLTQKLQESIQQNLMKKYVFKEDHKTASVQKQHLLQTKKQTRLNDHSESRVTKITKRSDLNAALSSLNQFQQNQIELNINKIKKQFINKQFQEVNEIFKQKKSQIRQIQYIGPKQFGKLQQNLKSKIQKQTMIKNHRKITMDLLKEFNVGVDFVQQEIQNKSGFPSLKKYVEMRNQDGQLIRKKIIPLTGSKKEIQNIVMKKIGILNQQQIARQNLHYVKNRKSHHEFEDPKKQKKKQLRRLSKISKSLPKLQNFYAKSKNLVFNTVRSNMNLIY